MKVTGICTLRWWTFHTRRRILYLIIWQNILQDESVRRQPSPRWPTGDWFLRTWFSWPAETGRTESSPNKLSVMNRWGGQKQTKLLLGVGKASKQIPISVGTGKYFRENSVKSGSIRKAKYCIQSHNFCNTKTLTLALVRKRIFSWRRYTTLLAIFPTAQNKTTNRWFSLLLKKHFSRRMIFLT